MRQLLLGVLCLLFFPTIAWTQKLSQFEYSIPGASKAIPQGITKESSVVAIAGTAKGQYFLTNRSGCYYMSPSDATTVALDAMPTDRRKDIFQHLLTKGDTTYLWANGYQLIELTGDKEKRTDIIGPHFATNMNPISVAMDQTGKLFVGTAQDGLFIFHPNGEGNFRVQRASTVNQVLPDNTVNCLYEDQDGVMWIGTDAGVATFFRDSVHNLSREAVTRSNSWWEKVFGAHLGTPNSFGEPIKAITSWGNSMLFLSEQTLTKATAQPDSLKRVFSFSINERLPNPLTEVQGILTDFDGNIWIYGDQLIRYNITSDKLTVMNNLYRMRGRSFMSVYEDLARDCIWIGTLKGGLYRYDLH